MRRRLPWFGILLLAGLLAGCDWFSCAPPPAPSATAGWTAPAGTPEEERGAKQVLDQARDKYRSQYELFIPETDYDSIIVTLRQGLAAYPRTTLAPEMQLFLADVCALKRQQFNYKDLVLFGGQNGEVGFDTASRSFLPYDEAIAEYEKIAAQWPQSVEARKALLKIGDLHLADYNPARDPRRALAYFERILRDYPKSVDEDHLLFRIANTWLELKDPDHAYVYFQRLVKEYPTYPADRFMLARNFIENYERQHPNPGVPPAP